MLPDLIIIGAAKCGTTSLHHYLKVHPEIFMANAKELNFFTGKKNWSRGLGWYESQFPSGGYRTCGESSPRYTAYPEYTGVPERMANVIPRAKLIYLVRDPMERIVSQYLHHWNEGVETRPARKAVLAPSPNRYVDRSMYAMQLERFQAHFPESQILVVDQHELQHERDQTMARVFRYVGVADDFGSEDFARLLNVTAAAVPPTGLGGSMLTSSVFRAPLATFRRRMPRAVRVRLVPPPPNPVLDQGLCERLADLLAPDTERFRALTGMQFTNWQV